MTAAAFTTLNISSEFNPASDIHISIPLHRPSMLNISTAANSCIYEGHYRPSDRQVSVQILISLSLEQSTCLLFTGGKNQ